MWLIKPEQWHGEFLSRNFESSYFKISLDWVLLGPSPHSKNVYLKKILMAFFEKSAHSAYFSWLSKEIDHF